MVEFLDFYKKNGYVILENIFSQEEITVFKNEVLQYIKNNKTIPNAEGITIPDFIKYPEFLMLTKVKENKKIQDKLEEIFGGNNYRFCSHNDIGINRIVGWHKDKLNGKYAKYETIDIWSNYNDENHEIVKVLIYLQDHSQDNYGLKLVPNSHLKKKIETNKSIRLHPKLGDVIIFDQRITHRGMEKQTKDKRILVSFGFGKNNVFTDNFEKGTIKRQNDQNLEKKKV
jgi:ectoine hydroxylase-related dioxygenase (phytanoyl-CoA dioxygenase family)